jgi:hypothetical protein
MAEEDVGDLPSIRVDVRDGGSSENKALLKVVWNDPDKPFEAYFVDADTLKGQAADVRGKLDALVRKIVKVGAEAAGRELVDLMEEGALLRRCLFDDGVARGSADKIVRWFGKRKKPFRLHISVDERLHVPWGLVYEGSSDVRGGSFADLLAACEGFWCLRYHLSATYCRVEALGEPCRKREDFQLLPLVDQALFDKVVGYLAAKSGPTPPGDLALVTRFTSDGEDAIIKKRDELVARWRHTAGRDRLLCFYGHANPTSLALGARELVTLKDLKFHMKGDEDGVAFWFLNGCSTAMGDPGGGFVEATSKSGFYGFIGTEQKVPDVFGLRFVLAFLASFQTSGRSVLDTMSTLRRAHLPLSLLYSVYCSPMIRIAPPTTPAAIDAGNLSCGIVGSDRV